MTEPNVVAPADAALLRRVAQVYDDGDACTRGGYVYDHTRCCHPTAARLRALAEMIDGEQWTERLTILARCWGQRSAHGQEGADERVCDQRECARCWREKARRIAQDRQEVWEQVGLLESECKALRQEIADLPPTDRGRDG